MILFLKIYFAVTVFFYVKRTIVKVRKSVPEIKKYLATVKIAKSMMGKPKPNAVWIPPAKPEYMRLQSELEGTRKQAAHWKDMYFESLSKISDEDK